MDKISLVVILLIFFATEIFYFRIATYFNITDKPNHRSSHSQVTIRGGGIIFTIALLICPFIYGNYYPFFCGGLLLIAIISFMDDINHIANFVRLSIHLLAILLLFAQLHMYAMPIITVIVAGIFCVAIINAVNFMDGINGITGGYAFITLSTLYYINFTGNFVREGYLVLGILSLIVFNFFNFRTRAKCFAGDVGSVGIAFIIIFFILSLILKTQSLAPVLLILVYLLDAFTTIMFRLIRQENIFAAHRTHFYQFLANETKLPHIMVATLYCFVQLLINIVLLKLHLKAPLTVIAFLAVSFILFIILRFIIEGPSRLLKNSSAN